MHEASSESLGQQDAEQRHLQAPLGLVPAERLDLQATVADGVNSAASLAAGKTHVCTAESRPLSSRFPQQHTGLLGVYFWLVNPAENPCYDNSLSILSLGNRWLLGRGAE
jgi:hypothetical protein